jgi:hypothetical protein
MKKRPKPLPLGPIKEPQKPQWVFWKSDGIWWGFAAARFKEDEFSRFLGNFRIFVENPGSFFDFSGIQGDSKSVMEFKKKLLDYWYISMEI